MRFSMRSPGNDISVSYFHESLSPDGEWFENPSYGWCWTPYDLSPDWRPYYDGHWVYTDYGWSWASNEPWGWATYHYGRWFFDESYGWAWVPGTEWAPAWVAWRDGDDYVGWAPLPPGARWDGSVGLSFADANAIPSDEWSFVPRQRMLDVNLRLQVILVARNVTVMQRSHDATRFELHDGHPANFGPDVDQIQRVIGRPVPHVKIIDTTTPALGRGQPDGRGSVGFFRPRVAPAPATQAPPPTITERRNTIPDAVLQRQRSQQQSRLESTLRTEQARLANQQKRDLRSPPPGRAADEIRKQHAAEQQAFEAHSVQQRQVLEQRMQKQIVKPGKADKAAGQGRDKGQGRGQDKKNR
jgi:hypothetical protein